MDDRTFQLLQHVLEVLDRTLKANEDGTFTIKTSSGERTYTERELLRLVDHNKWLEDSKQDK